MPLTAGTRLGPYEIVAPLGAGGMGEVYRARDARLGRDIAVKVLPEDLASSAERLARFEREARAVAALNHPNIVTLHSIEEAAGTRFLVMELIEGRSLSEVIAPGGLPLPRLLELAIPLADALVAAHEKGVVHRDLKPANVMVTRDGRIKVLDFGLAKPSQAPSGLQHSQAATMVAPLSDVGTVVGTVPYMAPEQVRGEAVDARSDLFSFGTLVYELASGSRPFAGPTPADVSSAILRDEPPSLSGVRPEVPAPFERILGRCLAKVPGARFQSALEVLNALRELQRTLDRGPASQVAPVPEAVASIAVLPFVNRSASPDDEYFSDGLADELLNLLAKLRGLRVAARTSAFHFKGKDTTIAEVGRALNVATVLEGSVRKAGPRVRISVQRVKVAGGYQLWSESYDRTLDDIFAVQDDIAQAVVRELRSTLLGEAADSRARGEAKAEVARAVKGRGTNPEAHRLRLQARHVLEGFTRQGAARAIELLDRALELDPEFAFAWVELGRAHSRAADSGAEPVVDGYTKARAAVERALELEPDLPDGHAALAQIQMVHDWDWRRAQASVDRALELAGANAEVLRNAGMLAFFNGRLDKAIQFLRETLEQDPLSARAFINLGSVYFSAGRLIEAEESYRRALELAPHRPVAHAWLAVVLLDQGRKAEAHAVAEQDPGPMMRAQAMAITHHASGRRADSDASLDQLVQKLGDFAAYQIAEVHGARGDVEDAFRWLERSYEVRDPGLTGFKPNPHFRSLRTDPRWSAMLRTMRLEDCCPIAHRAPAGARPGPGRGGADRRGERSLRWVACSRPAVRARRVLPGSRPPDTLSCRSGPRRGRWCRLLPPPSPRGREGRRSPADRGSMRTTSLARRSRSIRPGGSARARR